MISYLFRFFMNYATFMNYDITVIYLVYNRKKILIVIFSRVLVCRTECCKLFKYCKVEKAKRESQNKSTAIILFGIISTGTN